MVIEPVIGEIDLQTGPLRNVPLRPHRSECVIELLPKLPHDRVEVLLDRCMLELLCRGFQELIYRSLLLQLRLLYVLVPPSEDMASIVPGNDHNPQNPSIYQ